MVGTCKDILSFLIYDICLSGKLAENIIDLELATMIIRYLENAVFPDINVIL